MTLDKYRKGEKIVLHLLIVKLVTVVVQVVTAVDVTIEEANRR